MNFDQFSLKRPNFISSENQQELINILDFCQDEIKILLKNYVLTVWGN